MTKRRFSTIDVFTRAMFAGNPLAIVWDCEGLDDAAMQNLAREFNLSETIFVLPPQRAVNTARIRIFTPATELPFAGHPTVGGAAMIAAARAPEFAGARDLIVMLEEAVGDIRCHVRLERQGAHYCYFELPKLPSPVADADGVALAAALSLTPDDIGFDSHRPVVYSAGTPFCFAPVKSLDAVRRARPRADLIEQAACGGRGVFVYSRETLDPQSAAYARMFGAGLGMIEDPATGGAAAAFAGVATDFERPPDGAHTLVIEQGFDMGRPSHLIVGLTVAGGALTAATIGGHVMPVSEGVLTC